MKVKKGNKENLWIIDFTHQGKRIRRKITGTKKMAEQAAIYERERITRQKFGIPEPRKKIRFEDYAEYYRDNFTKDKRSRKNEEYVLDQLIAYFKGKFLNEITPGDVDRFIKQGQKKGLKNTTINRQRTVLHVMFAKAIKSKDYRIFENPVSDTDRLDEDSFRERCLTQSEIKRLLDAAESNPWGGHLPLFLTIALNTGMRKMEILSLTWSDVDFKNRIITVSSKRSKSKKKRPIPMNSIVFEALRKADNGHEHIFYNPKTKSHIRRVQDQFKRACRVAKITDLRVHDLRHSAASFLVNDCGISLVVAAEILGHSDIKMTRRYVHSTPAHRQIGVDRLGEIFQKSRHKVDKTPSVMPINQPQPPHVNVH